MKKISTLLLVIIISTSCEDQLYQKPVSSKIVNEFLQVEAEVEQYVNATYATLQSPGLYGLYLIALGDISSDNTFDEVPANDGGIYGELDEFTITPNNALIAQTWKDSYVCIQRANVVLNRITGVAYKDEKVKNSRKGEMQFLRALMYFNLVRLFGDVPLVTTETINPNTYFKQARTPVSEVYAQIIKDLTEAVTVLQPSSSQPGRVIKTAAQTLLAKVYLTQKRYSEARTLLNEVVSSKAHELLKNVSDIFATSNENNKEIIFAVQFATGVNGGTEGNMIFQQFSPSGMVSGSKGHNLPAKSLYALYEPGDTRRGGFVDVTSAGIPYSKKYPRPSGAITDGGSDVVVLRYADVLLMLAEADNELGIPDLAVASLNAVRIRASASLLRPSSQEERRQAIALERSLELTGEGHRWFDLLRTEKAITVMNEWFKANGKSTVIDENDLLLPIPQAQVNTGGLKQNPGY